MPIQHDLSIRVRYQETDAMGRVHHANYINYFELGRTELLRSAGFSYKHVEEEGFYLVVAEVGCRYLRRPCTTTCSRCGPQSFARAARRSSTSTRSFAAWSY